MLSTVSTQKKSIHKTDIDNNKNNVDNSSRLEEINNKVNSYQDLNKKDDIQKSFHKSEYDIFGGNSEKNGIIPDEKFEERNEENFVNNFKGIENKLAFGKISEQESNSFKDIIKGGNGDILANYNKTNKKFTFYDKSNNYLGSFDVYDLIYYIVNSDQKNKNSMIKIFGINYQKTDNDFANHKFIIENFIGQIKNSNSLLKSYKDSPFMGSIELLVKLNEDIYNFVKFELPSQLNNFNPKSKTKIENIIYKFMFELLNYTLELIVIISNIIKDQNRPHLKEQLIKYSVGIVYRISKYVDIKISKLIEKTNNLEKILNTSLKLKENIDNKLDNIQKQIHYQSNMIGGKNSSESEEIDYDSDSDSDSVSYSERDYSETSPESISDAESKIINIENYYNISNSPKNY